MRKNQDQSPERQIPAASAIQTDQQLQAANSPDFPQVEGFLSFEQVQALRSEYKESGRSFVFTSGCFDRLHEGHIAYLTDAAELAQSGQGILVIAVNSDHSERVRKGAELQPLETRVNQLLRAFPEAVLFSYDQGSDASLITQLRPDLFVKGGDYTAESLQSETREALASLGLKCRFLAHREGIHSSNIRRQEQSENS